MNVNESHVKTNDSPNAYRRWIIGALIAACIFLLIWFYSKPKPISVKIIHVQQGYVEYIVANTRAGTVKACRRAKLSPNSGGQITQLPVREGDHVKQNQLLLALWNEDLQAQLQLTQSDILSAQNQSNAACQQAAFSQREAQRLRKLHQREAISDEQLDNANTLAKIHHSNCQAAQATIKTKIAQQKLAEAALERTYLKAPFDGVIADISAELSEYVTPSPVGVQTLPVIDLIDNTCFYVAAPIDEVDAPAVSTGMAARITLDAFGDNFFQGQVRRKAAFVLDLEKQARTVEVEVEFANKDDHLKLLAGYSADVEVIIQQQSKVLRIPTEAILNDDNENEKVWLYHPATSTISKVPIKTGLSNWSYTEVTDGLSVDDKIVLSTDQEGLEDSIVVNAIEIESY